MNSLGSAFKEIARRESLRDGRKAMQLTAFRLAEEVGCTVVDIYDFERDNENLPEFLRLKIKRCLDERER